MLLPLQAPPFANPWVTRFPLSAAVRTCGSWLLAAVFLAIFQTWPSSSVSYHREDATSIQKIRHPRTSFSLPPQPVHLQVWPQVPLAQSPNQPTPISLSPLNGYVTWVGWSSESMCKEPVSVATSRVSLGVIWLDHWSVGCCLPTGTSTADFLTRILFACFIVC